MSHRNRGSSPYRDDDTIDDYYSDDFDDDATDTGNKRYKTRSPLNRTASGHEVRRPKDSRSSDSKLYQASDNGRPPIALGKNTHRKARGGMSLASGYLTPNSRKMDNLTPLTKLSLKSDNSSQNDDKDNTETAVSLYYKTPRSHGVGSKSPQKRVFYRSNRGRGRGKGRFSQLGRNSHDTSRVDNITKRVLSARRLKINETLNQNQELQLQLKDLKEENKLLKRTQLRSDKALQKFEDRESELPQLIQRQNNETRSLRDQIRKWREKYEKTDRYLRDAEDELEKVKVKLKKLKTLADEKDLPERAELNKKLNNSELEIEAKDVKIKELERHIQNLEKNHRHELGIERARQKETQRQLASLRDENEKLSVDVKEKEKEIQIKNIYANRAVKPPHRLPNSYNGTPHDTPPPRRRRPSLSEADKMTPRDRAKQMEEKRREELRRQRELKQRRMFADYQDTHTEQHEKVKREKELRKMKEEEEREEEKRREREEKQRRDYEEREQEMNKKAEEEAADRRMREERERLKREAEDRKQRELEKQQREERERKMREKREHEERERRERERQEQERRAAEERRRFEDDVTIQAERKKKDEILQKLREIDEGGQKDKKKDPFNNDPFFVTEAKEDSQDSMASSKKSYTFSKPTENLHRGKPARKDENLGFTVSKGQQGTGLSRRREVDSVETGGYNPTFGSKRSGANSTAATKTYSLFDDDDSKTTSTVTKPAQKSKLMEDLFGPKKDDGPKHNDLFASKPAAKKTNQSKSTFPWEEDGFSSSKQSGLNLKTKRENSATLFGGGSAFVNDEELHKSQVRSNASVPRRQKQTTAFHTRPTVNAVDHLDDDIEEVIL